jgi:hypothetical protein
MLIEWIFFAIQFSAIGSFQMAIVNLKGVKITSVCRCFHRISDALTHTVNSWLQANTYTEPLHTPNDMTSTFLMLSSRKTKLNCYTSKK